MSDNEDKNQQKKMDLGDKLVYSNALGGYILDVPEELKDKILVNHFDGFMGHSSSQKMEMTNDCHGGVKMQSDPCANLCSSGQMICKILIKE
jgi:hypothetical protein